MFEFHLSKKLRKRKIKFSHRDVEPQEVYLEDLAKKREKEFTLPERRLEVPISKQLLKIFFACIALIFLGFFLKTLHFQVFRYDEFSILAQENKFISRSIQTGRGVVYDSKGEQLVFNNPSFNLIVYKHKLDQDDPKKEDVFRNVSLIINQTYQEIKDKIEKEETNTVLIAENLDYQKLILIETKKSEFPGFDTEKSSVREYKDGITFSHIVGYTGKITEEEFKELPSTYLGTDQIGKVGIEKAYEEILRKNSGELKIERDVYGNQISREIIALPESGGSLVLWLDANLQRKVEEELHKTLERVGAQKAIGVAMDPKTGGILALVSIPSYDNNMFNQEVSPEDLASLLEDELNPLFNRVITGRYATGSTIKPLVAAAALEEGIIPSSKSLSCEGKISIPHRYDPEIEYVHKDWSTHGWTDVRKAIAESCNTYFYTIGGGYENQKGLGPSKLKEYLEYFGWGSRTGIDLPNEAQGFIPSPEWKMEKKGEGWWDGDTYNLSIGQGDIMITPLEVVASFGAVVNGGTLYQPSVVKEIVSSEKKLIQEIPSKIIKQNFIDPDTLEIVKQGMRRAVTGEDAPQASSKMLGTIPVAAAAKTGTAQTPIPEHYHNWITVFAPYEDPEIVLTIMVENVLEGQVVALPTARDILQWYFSQ